MCQDKKDCGCGCSIKKKPINESKQILKEGTWAPTIWDKNVALQAKNILQGLIESGESNSVNVSILLKRFEKKFWNKIGDDILYDFTGQTSNEFEKGLPNWKNTLTQAIQRIDQLEKVYTKENKLKEGSNYNLSKEGKYKHYCDSCDSAFGADTKKAKCPNCGVTNDVTEKPDKKKIFEKINLKLASNTKTDLVKQAKIALDAIYTVYSQCERKEIEHNDFLEMVDRTFENISELLAVLISQESVEQPKK